MKHPLGYTLFEVILSLILVMVILAMVTAAINMHLNQLTAGRTQTEESRLARAIFDQIARDIRNVVIEQQESSADQSDVSIEATTSEVSTDDTSTEALSESSEDSSTDISVAPEYGFIGTAPGIYGGTDWIQIDTKRTLFGERFTDQTVVRSGEDLEKPRLSTRKTTLYYLGEDTGTLDADDAIEKGAESSIAAPESPDQKYEKPIFKYGLYCRSLDHLAAEFAIDQGLETDLEKETPDDPMGPEVDDIEFLYYDGDEWLSEWNMDESKALPIAVRVILSIHRKNFESSKARNMSSSSEQNRRVIIYSLTIPISTELIQSTEEEEDTTST